MGIALSFPKQRIVVRAACGVPAPRAVRVFELIRSVRSNCYLVLADFLAGFLIVVDLGQHESRAVQPIVVLVLSAFGYIAHSRER